jgi:hypothetical protein
MHPSFKVENFRTALDTVSITKGAVNVGLLAAVLAQNPAAYEHSLSRIKEAIHGWSVSYPQSNTAHTSDVQLPITTDDRFVTVLESVYKDLAASQTDLDQDMKDLLYSNLWELY